MKRMFPDMDKNRYSTCLYIAFSFSFSSSMIKKEHIYNMMNSKGQFCPMGFFCFDKTTMILLVVAVCIIGALVFQQYMAALKTLSIMNDLKQPSVQRIEISEKPMSIDMQRLYNPLVAPEKRYYSSDNRMPPPLVMDGSVPINERTRGEPGGYQKVGVIMQNGKNLPLYGQQTYPGSSTWNYFTNTDGGQFHRDKLPVNYKGRNCADDPGCEEIKDGSTSDLSIPGYDNDTPANVVIYRNSAPRYIPYL